MMRIGLKPAMPDGGYLQPVPLKKGIVSEKLDHDPRRRNSYGQEFIASPYMPQAESSVSAPLVFVGYGISAPEMQYDDYKGIDVKGKIVVFFNAARKFSIESKSLFYHKPCQI
jgi:hypothetical protein